jgi:hypothetical protein
MSICKAIQGGCNIDFFHDHCAVKTTTKGQHVTFCYNQIGSLYPISEGVSPTQVNCTTFEGFIVDKQHKIPFSQGSNFIVEVALEFIYSNICGPMQTKSLNGYVYFATFIDAYF